MPNNHSPAIHFSEKSFQRALLAWYDGARRDLPWRAGPGADPDPYRVWLSEVMLQQTTVKAVIPYFEKFTAKWPTVEALAAASRDEVLAAWAGLGYYSRARNLYACAQEARGGFPRTEAALRALPGVGVYTAAAIAAIAFGEPAAVVDGNVERVLARLFALETPLPAAKPAIRKLAERLTPRKRPGDYAQAMMDLGATICAPRSPSCPNCPVQRFCMAYGRGEAERFPIKKAKAEKPERRGDAFVLVRASRIGPQILLRRRKDEGLLGGMMEVPTTEWIDARLKHRSLDRHREAALAAVAIQENPQPRHGLLRGVYPGLRAGARNDAGSELGRDALNGGVAATSLGFSGTWVEGRAIRHTFTHFHLELRVFARRARGGEAEALGGEWAALANLQAFALPAVMKKAVASGLEALGVDAPAIQTPPKPSSRASSVSTVERSARPSTRTGRK
jgi:A/G-specific adenine glycosylase